MWKRFIWLMLSVGGCLGCGAEGAEPSAEGAEPIEKVTSDITWSANGHDYAFVQTPQTWSAARGKCINYLGGHLATIGDSGENEFIRAMANQVSGVPWWIGRNDMANETFWRWENNEALRYDNWAPGEPNNFNNEDCATLDPFNGQWNDRNCTNTLLGFVCERDQGAALPNTTMTYNASNTNSDTQNYVVFSFDAIASTVVTLGTCGLPGATNTGDTFLRVFNAANSVEIVSNDDACGGAGSNISFIPSVSGHFTIRAGCWGAGTCSGAIAVRSPG